MSKVKKAYEEEANENEFLEEEFGEPIVEDIVDVDLDDEDEKDISSSNNEEAEIEEVELEEVELEEHEDMEEEKGKSTSGKNKLVAILVGIVGVGIVVGMGAFIYGIYSDIANNPQTPIPPSVSTKIDSALNATKNTADEAPSVSNADMYGVTKVEGKVINQDPQDSSNMYGVPNKVVSSTSSSVVPATEAIQREALLQKERETTSIPSNGEGAEYYGIPKEEKTAENGLTGVETELMGISGKTNLDIQKGGVCELSVKYETNKEYVYYIFRGGEFIPVFKDEKWDKKGVVLGQKVVAESYAPIEKFIEVEKGKYLPSEMFSKCEPF